MANYKRGKQKMKVFRDSSGYDTRFVGSATRTAWVRLPKLRRQDANETEQVAELDKGPDDLGPTLAEYTERFTSDSE